MVNYISTSIRIFHSSMQINVSLISSLHDWFAHFVFQDRVEIKDFDFKNFLKLFWLRLQGCQFSFDRLFSLYNFCFVNL